MDKMQAVGTSLGNWGLQINRGITTGLNDAFIVDNPTKDSLVARDPKSADIVKPALRGQDIGRYRVRWAGWWIVDTHNGYGDIPHVNIERYHAVKAHLDGFSPRLENRQDQGRTPYNLRNCTFHEEFAKEKLFWMDMSGSGRFAYSESETFCNNKGYIITGRSLKYLCAVLNSMPVTWYMKHTAPTTGMGLTEWTKVAVERIPIPEISDERHLPFVLLVDEILAAKDTNPDVDTAELEEQIDRLVYDLYGLTDEEITAVERSLGLIHATDDEEDAALSRAIADDKRQLM